MRVLNTQQMREADRRTIDVIGIPSIVLMENAGRQAVAAMEAAFDGLADSRVGVLCGRGNNGGDGFVVARTLLQRGIDAAVFVVGALAEVKGDARVNLEILGNTDPFLHAHVWPRYDWEPDDLVRMPVWLYPRDSWSAPEHALGPRHDPLRAAIGAELDKSASRL